MWWAQRVAARAASKPKCGDSSEASKTGRGNADCRVKVDVVEQVRPIVAEGDVHAVPRLEGRKWEVEVVELI